MNTQANAYRTAITRKTLSKPMRHLVKENLLQGRTLDYGCGKGSDAKELGMESFDPHFQPERPTGKFDTITCHYVLNVVTDDVAIGILEDIADLLNPGGSAYISVRRDFKEDYVSQTGALQRIVGLTLPIEAQESGSYCMYHLTKS